MKKILLIPITLTALTPMVSMAGCGEPEANEYRFEFTGNNCTIDGLAHFITLIKKGEKVEYIVEPDSGHMLSSTQDLPEGITLVGNILTIEKMDKPYAVTVNAVLPLTIEGLKKSYQGDIGVAGHTDPITVYYDDGESKTDVTTSATFNLPSLQLTWDATNKWLAWSDDIDADEYTCQVWVTYSDYTSDIYTTKLNIASGELKLACEGVTESQVFQLYSTGPGEISPVSFLFYDGQKAKPTDVTKQIIMQQLLSDYVHWDGSGEHGRFYWESINPGTNAVSVQVLYEYKFRSYDLSLSFVLKYDDPSI